MRGYLFNVFWQNDGVSASVSASPGAGSMGQDAAAAVGGYGNSADAPGGLGFGQSQGNVFGGGGGGGGGGGPAVGAHGTQGGGGGGPGAAASSGASTGGAAAGSSGGPGGTAGGVGGGGHGGIFGGPSTVALSPLNHQIVNILNNRFAQLRGGTASTPGGTPSVTGPSTQSLISLLTSDPSVANSPLGQLALAALGPNGGVLGFPAQNPTIGVGGEPQGTPAPVGGSANVGTVANPFGVSDFGFGSPGANFGVSPAGETMGFPSLSVSPSNFGQPAHGQPGNFGLGPANTGGAALGPGVDAEAIAAGMNPGMVALADEASQAQAPTEAPTQAPSQTSNVATTNQGGLDQLVQSLVTMLAMQGA